MAIIKNLKINKEMQKLLEEATKVGGIFVLVGAILTGGSIVLDSEDTKKTDVKPIPTYSSGSLQIKETNIKLTDEETNKYLEQYNSNYLERELKGVPNPKYEEYLKMYNSELYEKGIVIEKTSEEEYLIVYKIGEDGIRTMQEVVLPYVVLTEEEYEARGGVVTPMERGEWALNPEFSKYVELFNQYRKNAINRRVSVYDPSNDENIELLYPLEANYIEVIKNGESTRIYKWLIPEFGYNPEKSKQKVRI